MSDFHILNPSKRRPEVESLTRSGLLAAPWAWVAREHPDHLETLVEWCLREGVRRIVVWGGDGTLHRVVRALWVRQALGDVDVSLVPSGTCNDFARWLGLSFQDARQWASTPPPGRRLSLSLGRLRWGGGEDVFINNAGFGRPKASFDRRDPPWRTLMSFQPLPVSARWEAGEVRGLYYMGLFCRGPFFSGGLHFDAAPLPEDGLLRTYLIPARSKPRLAARLLAARFGRPLGDDKITKLTGSHVKLTFSGDVWPQVDGEPPLPSPCRELEVDLLPQRLCFWSPR